MATSDYLNPKIENNIYLYKGMIPEGYSNKLQKGSGKMALSFFFPS